MLVAAGMCCAPLISLQPFAPPPVVTYADICFVVGFALLLPRLLRQPLKAPALFLVGALLLVCFALVGLAIHPDVSQSATGLVRLLYAVIALPLAFRWWNPSLGRITLLVTAYLLGCVYSLVYGLIKGPLADDRHLGLATHPNGFGISLALGLSLVPYLAWRMGDLGLGWRTGGLCSVPTASM